MLTEGFVCPGNGQKGIGSGVNLRPEEDTDATDFFGRDRYTDPHKGGDRLRIYLDLAILLNTAVDFMLLMGTNALAGFPSGWKRNLAAAVLGGFYGGLCLLPMFSFLGGVLWRGIFLGLMASVAFGWNRGSIKRIGIFVLLSMAMGGIAIGFGQGRFGTVLLSGVCVWILCIAAFGGRVGEREYVPVTVSYEEREVRVLALKDTGNTLRDPITGEQVLVLSADAAERLTGLTKEQIESPLDTLASRVLPGLRLIPYRAVGQGGGMLLAMRFDNVKIGSRQQSAVVAFAAEGLGEGTMYQALTGGL